MKTPARLLCLLLATGLPAFGQYSGYSPYPTQYVPSGPPATMKAPTGALGFEVPIERVNHYFYLQYRTTPSGPVQMASGMYQTGFITSGAGVGAADLRSLLVTCQIPYGTYTYTPTTYSYTYNNYVYINGNIVAVPTSYTYTSSTSTYVPFNAYEWWLVDSTAGQESWHNINSTPTASNDLRTIAWTTPSGVPNRYFAVPESRLGHGLIYGDPTGAWSAVSSGYLIGTYSNGTSGTPVPLHWFTASATQPANTAASFIADRTADEKTAPGTTDVRAGSVWTVDANYSIYPLVAVTVQVEALEAGHLFTVHGYVPGAPTQLKSVPALAGATSTANATLNFVIGAGMQFWVTRDAEDYAANQPLAPATGTWTANAATTFSALGRFRATPLRAAALVPHHFSVNATPGGAHAGHTFTVRMTDGYSTVFGPVANAQTTAYGTGQIPKWLDNGQSVPLAIYTFAALLDPTRITMLIDNATGAQMGVAIGQEPTEWLDGWQRGLTVAPPVENTTITLQLPGSRLFEQFALHHAPPDSGVSLISSYLSLNIPTPPLVAGVDGMASYHLNIASLTFTNPTPYFSGPFVLEDLTALQTQTDIHVGLNDLSTWFMPEHPVSLQISSSRWDHNLVVRHPNGDFYPIQRGAVAGSTSAPPGLPTWYQDYYYFDASSLARSEMPWYVEDTDTNERLGFLANQYHPTNSALINWIAVPPPGTLTGNIKLDGSIGLQWPLSSLASPQGGFEVERLLTGETAWQTIATPAAIATGIDGYEHFADTHPVMGKTRSYRIRYTFGGHHSAPSNVLTLSGWLDTDGDGIPDWWELAHGLNPNYPGDAGRPVDSTCTTYFQLFHQEIVIPTVTAGNGGTVAGGSSPVAASGGSGVAPTGSNAAAGAASDPNKDSDGDGVRDRDDRYPNDKKRSRDIPVLNYLEIDISTPIIGAKNVANFALDDTDQVAFSYVDDSSADAPINVILWKNGAQVGNVINYQTSGETSVFTWKFYPFGSGLKLNAAGEIAGTLEYGEKDPNDPMTYTSFGGRAFSMSPGASEPNVIKTIAGRDLNDDGFGWLDGLKNSGLYWGVGFHDGNGSFTYIGDQIITLSGTQKVATMMVNETGQAVLMDSDNNYSLWDSGSQIALAAGAVSALGDDGTVFGVNTGTPTDPGLPAGSNTAFTCNVSDGSKTEFTSQLPSVFRKQLAFFGGGAAINSAGDILFGAQSLEGPESDPQWNDGHFLWIRQTSTAAPNGTLYKVTNADDATLFNAHNLIATTRQKYPLGADGKEDKNKTPYTAAVLLIPMQMVALDAKGQPTTESYTAAPSFPSPVVDVSSLSISDVAAGGDGKLRGTVHATGKITSALCDSLPGDDGKIEQAKLYVNGGASPTTITVTASKGSSGAFGSPYQYEGTFNATLPNIELAEGENVLRFNAEDKIYKIAGFSEWTVNVRSSDVNPDDDSGGGGGGGRVKVDVLLTLPAATLDCMQIDVISLALTDGTHPPTPVALTETDTYTLLFHSSVGGVSASLPDGKLLRANHRNSLVAIITDPLRGLSNQTVHLTETALGSHIYTGSIYLAVPAAAASSTTGAAASSPSPTTYTPEEPYLKNQTDGGELHLGALRFGGSKELLDALQIRLGHGADGSLGTITSTLSTVVKDGWNYLKNLDADGPAIFSNRPHLANPDTIDETTLSSKIKTAAAHLPPAQQFQLGFGVGFAAGGGDMVCGLGHLVHLGIEEVVTETSILGFGVAIGLKKAGGLDAAQEVFTELGLIQIQVDKAKALESFFWLAVQWQGEEEALKMALLTGQISNTEDLYCNMGELHRRLCQYSFEAMAGILKEFVDGEPYDKGRILGRATFEIAAILVTPEMIAGQVSKLQFIEKLLAAAPKFMKAGQVARLAADLAPVKAALESDAVLVAVKAAGKTNPARELIVSLKLLVEADFAAGKGFRADLYVNYVREAIAKGDEFSGFEIAKGAQDIVVKDLADIAAGKANIELKSYEWWTNRFPSIGDGQGGWEFHHLIENQIWNRLMGFADGTRTSNIPAIPLKGWNKSAADVPYGPFHRGANGVGLSEKINAEVMKVADDAEMLGALKRLYTEPPFGELGMWPATRDWLRANLPNAKKALVPN